MCTYTEAVLSREVLSIKGLEECPLLVVLSFIPWTLQLHVRLGVNYLDTCSYPLALAGAIHIENVLVALPITIRGEKRTK